MTTIAEGKARIKRRKLTGEQYKSARDFARSVTGYGPTSPIWGKQMPEVLTMIAEQLDIALTTKEPVSARETTAKARDLVTELARRVATGKIIAKG